MTQHTPSPDTYRKIERNLFLMIQKTVGSTSFTSWTDMEVQLSPPYDRECICAVLNRLIEQKYIQQMHNRVGGAYRWGENFDQWERAMTTPAGSTFTPQINIENMSGPLHAGQGDINNISGAQADALIALIRELVTTPQRNPSLFQKVKDTLGTGKTVVEIIKDLVLLMTG